MVKRLRSILARRLPRFLVALNVGLALGGLALWLLAYHQGLAWRADFTVLYTGSLMVTKGLPDQLYDFEAQTRMQQEILVGRHLAGGLLPFNYPPHLALILAPLSFLSLEQAYVAWFMIQLGLVGWIGWMLWRHLEAECASVLVRCLVIVTVAALPFLSSALILGALSLLMLLSWLGFALAVRRGDGVAAAVWVVVMTLKPQVAVVPALVLLVSQRGRPRRLLIGLLLTMALVTSFVLGHAAWPGFTRAVLRTFLGDVSLGVTPRSMYTLRGTLASIPGYVDHPGMGMTSVVAFALSCAVIARLWWGESVKRLDVSVRIALSLLLALLFSLHAYPQDTALLAVPCLLFGGYLKGSSSRATLYVGAMSLVPALFWGTERVFDTTMFIIRVPTLVMTLLGIWMLCCMVTDQASDGPRIAV